MKTILTIFLIMVLQFSASESSVYDWHVRTIESDSDFGDDLKVQTALNNERQQDLFKISGKTNNIEYYPNSYYNLFKENYNGDSFGDNVFMNTYDRRHEEKLDFQSLYDPYSKQDSKKGNASNYQNDYEYNEDQYNKYKTHKNGIFDITKGVFHRENDEEFTKKIPHNNNEHLNYTDENKINYHINNVQNMERGNEIKDKQTLNNKVDENFKENQEFVVADHCSEKYIDIESFVGTNLFDSAAKKCFSGEDVALLAVRKDFESLIPKRLPQCLFDDRIVALLLNYFYICHQMIMQTTPVNTKPLAQKAFYDTLGGYLNFYMVPVTKYSYYAGQIGLNTAQRVLNLHQESKKLLNTHGNGWKAPLKNVLTELKSIHIEPLYIPDLDEDTHDGASFCMQLDRNRGGNQPHNDKMIVQLPKLAAENFKGNLGNIWLPFRHKNTFDLKTEGSCYVIVKFYEIVTKCYRLENIDQEYYNQQFEKWLVQNINIHLSDEVFYPGLGAVLRIYEYLKKPKKHVIGISNDFNTTENMDASYKKQHNLQISSEQLHKRGKTTSEVNHDDPESTIDEISEPNNIELSTKIVDQQNKIIPYKDNKLEAAVKLMSRNSKAILRSLHLTPTQIAIIAIPVIVILLIIVIWCCNFFCKKKKHEQQISLQKNSSSSSSRLFNSPVRFFSIRKKSASNTSAKNYSSNESANKKNRKSVKIDKKSMLSSDSSISSSPARKKKSKESTGSKDKAKSKDVDKK